MRSSRPDKLDDAALNDRLEFAIAIARDAADVIMPFYKRDDLRVMHKGDSSPVTLADQQAEKLVRNRIDAIFPADGILGEEYGTKAGSNSEGFNWIVDPIDGTESFIRGVPFFGTLLGIEFANTPVAGVIMLPAIGEMLYASKGNGTWIMVGDDSPRQVYVSKISDPALALFVTTGGEGFNIVHKNAIYERLNSTFGKTRSWGDCYGYYMVATGRAEIMVDPIISPWDIAAILPIIEEAGGMLTDWTGVPTIRGPNSVGSNGMVHDLVLDILSLSDD